AGTACSAATKPGSLSPAQGTLELYLIVGGSGRIKLDDEVVELEQWDAVRISTETMRCVEAGPEGLELVAFGAPYTGPGDAELTPGWWADS
ncbi:MAG: hypothetical protein ACRDM9_09795, partial [Gaiellaceae bacterium]